MKKCIYILKLYDCDIEIICKSREDLIDRVNDFIDLDLYNKLTIGTLQNVFKYSTNMFFDNTTNYHRKVNENCEYTQKELNKHFKSNKKYTDIYLTPYIEYIISYNWIDYTNELFELYYPQKIDINESNKRKYRERIVNSEIKKNIYRLSNSNVLTEDMSINYEMNTTISEDTEEESEEEILKNDNILNESKIF